jgi:hypothetical protein
MMNNSVRRITRTIHCCDRYAIVKVGTYMFIDVYLLCVGTTDRLLSCQDIFVDMWSWCERYLDHEFIIAGDFNINLDNDDDLARFIHSFCMDHSLPRCDNSFPSAKVATLVNESCSHYSLIDYMLTSSPRNAISYEVVELDINFSDYLPILGTFTYHTPTPERFNKSNAYLASASSLLRWDHADLLSFYEFTRGNFVPFLHKIDATSKQFGDKATIDMRGQISQTCLHVGNYAGFRVSRHSSFSVFSCGVTEIVVFHHGVVTS